MIKEFQTKIPLPLKSSFYLLQKSGADLRWRSNSHDSKSGMIIWKQGFWALTGTAVITATLKQKKEDITTVVIAVSKPLQIFDPLGICDKIFFKLDKAWQKNLPEFKKALKRQGETTS